jgi:DNA-binding winged helix-turn-helix (wHTH) protein
MGTGSTDESDVNQAVALHVELADGKFELIEQEVRLKRGDRSVMIESQPFAVLCFLIRHRREVVSRERIFRQFKNWYAGANVEDAADSINQSVSKIRRALRDLNDGYIRTVRGHGYQFVASVQDVSARSMTETPPPSTLPRVRDVLRHDVRVAEWADVRSWGWDAPRLLDKLIALDFVLFPNLDPGDEGETAQWHPVFEEHPDMWRLIVDGNDEIVGYWHFVLLHEQDHQAAREGKLIESSITIDRVVPLRPGRHKMYFVSVGLITEFRRHHTLLLDSLFEIWTKLAARKILFDEIVTNAYTADGLRLCKSLNFRKLCAHARRGMIFEVTFPEMLQTDYFYRHPALRMLYGV